MVQPSQQDAVPYENVLSRILSCSRRFMSMFSPLLDYDSCVMFYWVGLILFMILRMNHDIGNERFANSGSVHSPALDCRTFF